MHEKGEKRRKSEEQYDNKKLSIWISKTVSSQLITGQLLYTCLYSIQSEEMDDHIALPSHNLKFEDT